MPLSIIHYEGLQSSNCGYCGRKSSSVRAGAYAWTISAVHLNQFLDRGWCRCGCYLYKPDLEISCCPQYTIRLDVNKFVISRSQKRVLQRMNDFLKYDKRCKAGKQEFSKTSMVFAEEIRNSASSQSKIDLSEEPSSCTGREECSDVLHQQQDKSFRRVKKKHVRKERALWKLRNKGVNIEEYQRKRTEKENARCRTLQSYFKPDGNSVKHKLEVNLVRLCENMNESLALECFELFKKYQAVIHSVDSSFESFLKFLLTSPLYFDDPSSRYGSFINLFRLDNKLFAVAVIDILPRSLSSKYVFYDPEYSFLSLGTYTALSEIALTKELSIPHPDIHYYLMGYYIDSCPKMRYKSRFRPSELLCNLSFTWVPIDRCIDLLHKSQKKHIAFAPEKGQAPRISIGPIVCFHKRMVMSYGEWMSNLDILENEAIIQEYANLIGPLAKEVVIFRNFII